MFKSLAASNGFSTHTNPCWLEVGGKSLLATAGQNLDDVFKYVEGENEKRLELAKNMLEWRHMAPTAPDTLCTLPRVSSLPPDDLRSLADPRTISFPQGAIRSTRWIRSSSSTRQTSTSSATNPNSRLP